MFEQLAKMEDLPQEDRGHLSRMLDALRDRFAKQHNQYGVRIFAVFLRSLCAPLEHAATTNEGKRRSIVERALDHLQRSLVVDAQLRARWDAAFQDREEACEALGAVHLLSHGVFAFKINAAGARTDLVFAEPASITAPARASDVLVLTEWKVVRKARETITKATEARDQASRYAGGILRGLELAGYRYVVLVSDLELEAPDDVAIDGVTYRHICINIDPSSPSTAARNSSQRRRR